MFVEDAAIKTSHKNMYYNILHLIKLFIIFKEKGWPWYLSVHDTHLSPLQSQELTL